MLVSDEIEPRRARAVGRAPAGDAQMRSAVSGAPVSPARVGARRRIARHIGWIIRHAGWRLRLLEYGWPLVEKELESAVAAPRPARWRMWRLGFLGESRVLYDLRRNDPALYLTDHARYVHTRLINGPYAVLLDDKLVFQRILATRGALLPELFGTVAADGGITASRRPMPPARSVRWLHALARRHGKVVIKPGTGGGGRGVMVLAAVGPALYLNGNPLPPGGLADVLEAAPGSMVCEHIAQHPALARLNPDTTNTLRVLAMQDDLQPPFVAAAVLRIGSRASAPTDNWTRGGLSAAVNLATGRAGRAAAYPADRDALDWRERHPETGVAIAGMQIPNWPAIVEGLEELMRELPMLRYVGWDVVVTRDGFRLLEGNNFSDVNLLQIHAPLLRDDRVAAFYRRHGAVKP